MHEVAIVQGILGSVEKQRELYKFNEVKLIEITAGKYNCVSEDCLKFCFETSSKNTYLEGADLKLVRLPEKYRCSDCNTDSFTEKEVCPSCGSNKIALMLNSEIYLSKLEVE